MSQKDVMERGWSLRRRVLPQHTDHAGVMWHGAYLGFLEEARVEALATVGLAYSDLSAQGLELPVVALSINYRQALMHGEGVEIRSRMEARRGLRLPWRSVFLNAEGLLAAEAHVELVVLRRGDGPGRRLLRRLPADLERALEGLERGPTATPGR